MRPQVREDNLLVEKIGDELLVYDLARDRAHRLSRSAALIWLHCDGQRTVADLARVVADHLDIDADERVVWLVLSELERARLLRELLLRPGEIRGVSRRFAISAGLAGAAVLLLEGCGVDSITAPTPMGSVVGSGTEQLTTAAKAGTCDCQAPLQPKPPPRADCRNTGDTRTTTAPGQCLGTDADCPNGRACTVTATWTCEKPNAPPDEEAWRLTGRAHDCPPPKPKPKPSEPPPTPPPSEPPPTPPPSGPPPPPECVGTFPVKKGGLNGQGATRDLALRDLAINATSECQKLCDKKSKTCPGSAVCIPSGQAFLEPQPTCFDTGAPGKKRWQCTQTLVSCSCECGSS